MKLVGVKWMNGEMFLPECFLFTDQHQVKSFVIIFFFEKKKQKQQQHINKQKKGAASCCNYRFLQMEDERRVYFSFHFFFSPLFLLLEIFSFAVLSLVTLIGKNRTQFKNYCTAWFKAKVE